MADLTRTIEIVFGAVDNASQTIRSINTDLDKFDASIQSVAQPVADATKKLLTMEAALLSVSAAMGVKAVESAGKFESGINEIASISGLAGSQLEDFSQSVLDYSFDSVKSIDDINKAIYTAVSAGVDWKDSLDLLSVTEKLSIAGKADLEATTKVLISTLNAYGASVDQAQKYSDTLFLTVKYGQTTLPELSSSLGQVTGIASTAGVSFTELGAAIAALTVGGVGTSESITGIKAALSNIISPSDEAKKAADALGIQFDSSALKTKGFKGVLDEVYTATGGNIGKMTDLFGSVEALNAVMILGADKAGVFKKASEEMANSVGATDAAFESMAGNIENVTQKLNNQLRVIFIDAGREMLNGALDVADGLSSILSGISIGLNNGAFDPVFNALDAFGVRAKDYLTAIGDALPDALSGIDWGPLLNSFDNLGTSVSTALNAIFDNVDLTTPEGLREAIQRLVDVFTSLNNFTAGFVTGITPLLDTIAEFAERAREGGSEAETMGGKVGAAAVILVELGTKLGGLILILGQVSNGISAFTSMVTEGLVGAWNLAAGSIRLVVAGILEILEGLALAIGSIIPGEDMFDNLANMYNDMANSISADAEQNFAAANEAVTRFSTALLSVGDSAEHAQQATFDFGRNVADSGQGLDEWGTKADGAADSAQLLAQQIDAAAQYAVQGARSLSEVNQILDGIYGTTQKAAGGFDTYAQALNALTASHKQGMIVMQDGRYVIDDFYNSTEQVTQATEKSTAATKTGSEEWKRVQDVLTNNTKVANEYKLKLEELSLKKYEIDVQARVDMNIADLEAQTARFQASLDSTVAMAQSSADIISSALSTLSSINEWMEPQKFALVQQVIQAELDNRRREIDLQEQLINKQMEYLAAKAARLNSGDALIKIDGGQLQTELQLVFDKILKFTQVKATEDGLALLLGV